MWCWKRFLKKGLEVCRGSMAVNVDGDGIPCVSTILSIFFCLLFHLLKMLWMRIIRNTEQYNLLFLGLLFQYDFPSNYKNICIEYHTSGLLGYCIDQLSDVVIVCQNEPPP